MYREKVIVGQGTEYPLDGELTFPDGAAKPFPAVVMVHGSGPSDKDERVMKLTPFRDLADGLAMRGIASLRYDKRTFAHKRKLAKTDTSEITVREETIDDALLAIEILKQDPRIDRDNIYILGHSMGAMLAPRIDAEGGNVRGLIMMAGSPHRLEDIVVRQLSQAEGGNPVLKLIIGLERKVYASKFDGLYEMSDEEAKHKKFAGKMSLYYFKEMGRKTAADYLLESSKPVLIMQGGRDVQALADEDFAGFKELLGGRENTVYRLYPDLDHAFVTALYDDITKAAREFGTERHIGSEVLNDIADFIKETGQ